MNGISSSPSAPAGATRPTSPLALLVRVSLIQAWRRLKSIRNQSRLLTAFIALFMLVYLALSAWLFYRGLQFIATFPGLTKKPEEFLAFLRARSPA